MVEEFIVAVFILTITFLVFTSAIMRTIRMPINWAPDLALLLFAWVCMLGGDVALRRADFLRVDILVSRFPVKAQKFFYYLWYGVSIAFLGILIRFGIPLAITSGRRLFQTLGISYSWATISVPVGAALMILTIIIKLASCWNEKEISAGAKEVA